MASALGFVVLLALAGAVLHLAWHLVLAILIWALSAAGGISIGWYVASWTSNATLGIGVAILAAKPTSPKLSRRRLIAGAAVTPLIIAAKPAPQQHVAGAGRIAPVLDPVVEMARECLELHRESERLHRRYGDVESALFDNCKRLKLSKAQQSAQPEARKLYEISDRLNFLWKDRPRKMRRLRNTPATSLEGIIGKLKCVAGGMEPDEFPSAFKLLQATISDLEAFRV